MKRITISLAFIIFLVLCGCDSSGGGGGTSPDENAARIIESFTCRDVDSEGRPTGITEIFDSSEDDRIYVWMSWENVSNTHIAKAIWYNPSGGRELDGSEEFTSGSGYQIVWFYLDPAALSSGRWEVEIWLDNDFHRSHFFVID